jgi:hypothetical protein
MRVEVDFEGGKNAAGIYVHKKLPEVGARSPADTTWMGACQSPWTPHRWGRASRHGHHTDGGLPVTMDLQPLNLGQLAVDSG